MVSKITLFEPHFDGAQFGPASIAGPQSSASSTASETDDPDPTKTVGRSLRTFLTAESATNEKEADSDDPQKSRVVTVLQATMVFVVMFVVLYSTLRWILSRDDDQSE